MKLIRLVGAVGLLAALGCAPERTPVPVRDTDALVGDDLGVGKYVFEAKVPAGKVMVLRRTEEWNGRKAEKGLETIQFADGGVARQVVLVFDSSRFPFGDNKPGTIRVRAQGGEGGYGGEGRMTRSTAMIPGKLTLLFADEAGRNKVELTYECFVEDYAKAKARVPDLKAMVRGETWSHNARFEPE